MKYCRQCGSEYENAAIACSECGKAGWLTAEEWSAQNARVHAWDERRLVSAGVANDFLSMSRLRFILEEAGIPVFPKARHQNAVNALTGGGPSPSWEMWVFENTFVRASELIREELVKLDASAAENALAAEAEASATLVT